MIYELKSYGEEFSVKNCIVRSILNRDNKQLEILIFNSYSHEILGAMHLTESILEFIKLSNKNELVLKDILTGESYTREKEVLIRGMFVRLESGKAHWFVIDVG